MRRRSSDIDILFQLIHKLTLTSIIASSPHLSPSALLNPADFIMSYPMTPPLLNEKVRPISTHQVLQPPSYERSSPWEIPNPLPQPLQSPPRVTQTFQQQASPPKKTHPTQFPSPSLHRPPQPITHQAQKQPAPPRVPLPLAATSRYPVGVTVSSTCIPAPSPSLSPIHPQSQPQNVQPQPLMYHPDMSQIHQML